MNKIYFTQLKELYVYLLREKEIISCLDENTEQNQWSLYFLFLI
jgi:hypothetical protein